MINKVKLQNILITFFLLLFCAFLPEAMVKNYGWVFYLLQFIGIVYTIFRIKDNGKIVFSPSMITIFYLSLNFILGHYVISNEIGFKSLYSDIFKRYESHQFITAYFLLCNLVVLLAIDFRKTNEVKIPIKFRKNFSYKKIWLLIGVIVLFSFIKFDLSFIGGAGDFSYVLKLTVTIFMVIELSQTRNKKRWIFYGIILLLFIIGHFDSKREFMYVVILILFLEIVLNKYSIRLSIKQLLIGGTGFIIILWAIVSSSIMRGYGNYETNDNFLTATKYVPDYLSSDFAKLSLVNNFELNTVYGNGSNAVDYVYSDKVNLLYGSTFAKFLFLPIPRSLIPDKPDSMIHIYTNEFMPDFRAIGGSFPVILYSEAFWNFSVFGIVFIFIFYKLINNLYLKTIKNIAINNITIYTIFGTYLYVTIIQFVRGSGLELWLLYPIISLPFIFIIRKIIETKVR